MTQSSSFGRLGFAFFLYGVPSLVQLQTHAHTICASGTRGVDTVELATSHADEFLAVFDRAARMHRCDGEDGKEDSQERGGEGLHFGLLAWLASIREQKVLWIWRPLILWKILGNPLSILKRSCFGETGCGIHKILTCYHRSCDRRKRYRE